MLFRETNDKTLNQIVEKFEMGLYELLSTTIAELDAANYDELGNMSVDLGTISADLILRLLQAKKKVS